MPRKLSFTSGRGQLVQGNPIRSALVEQILRQQGRSPQFIPDAGTLGVNLGAELVRALTLQNAEKREQADRQAAIKERQAARAPRRTEGVSLDFVNAPTDNRFASDLPAGEFGSEAERAALATQLNVENQSRPLNLSERLNVSNQAAGGPLRPGPAANQVPQITRNPTLREQASSLQNPRNAGLAERLFATDTINQENLAQLVLRLQNQAGIAAQNRELTRRGQDISAKTRIDAANISANRPRPGITEPFPDAVQQQKLEQARAGAPSFAPIFDDSGKLIGQINTKTGERKAVPPPKQSVGQEAVDRAFGKDFAENIAGGGLNDAIKNLDQLEGVAERLDLISEGISEENLTGPALGRTPDFIKELTNQAAIDAREQVEEVVQRNLRVILGAQFTEKEGTRLIARAFNPNLDEKINAQRLRRLIKSMRGALEAKQRAAKFFEENGTLSGFKGTSQFSIKDFDNAITDARLDKGQNTEAEASTLEDGTEQIGRFKVRIIE